MSTVLFKQWQQSWILGEITLLPCTSYRAIFNVCTFYQITNVYQKLFGAFVCVCVTCVASPMNSPLTVQCIFIRIDAPAQGTTEESLHLPSLTWVILYGRQIWLLLYKTVRIILLLAFRKWLTSPFEVTPARRWTKGGLSPSSKGKSCGSFPVSSCTDI